MTVVRREAPQSEIVSRWLRGVPSRNDIAGCLTHRGLVHPSWRCSVGDPGSSECGPEKAAQFPRDRDHDLVAMLPTRLHAPKATT